MMLFSLDDIKLDQPTVSWVSENKDIALKILSLMYFLDSTNKEQYANFISIMGYIEKETKVLCPDPQS